VSSIPKATCSYLQAARIALPFCWPHSRTIVDERVRVSKRVSSRSKITIGSSAERRCTSARTSSRIETGAEASTIVIVAWARIAPFSVPRWAVSSCAPAGSSSTRTRRSAPVPVTRSRPSPRTVTSGRSSAGPLSVRLTVAPTSAWAAAGVSVTCGKACFEYFAWPAGTPAVVSGPSNEAPSPATLYFPTITPCVAPVITVARPAPAR
jgi:hypothetical protein